MQAGQSFIEWLLKERVQLSFIGSSYLMRAAATAYSMFHSPCAGTSGLDCSAAIAPGMQVMPIPYMTERAPAGITAIEMDNTPYDLHEQTEVMHGIYGQGFSFNTTYANSKLWPRFGQQFEKFKAFLTMIVLPSVSSSVSWVAPDHASFQKALASQLPTSMHPEEHGKAPVTVEWEGGRYETGEAFTKEEYDNLDVPVVSVAIVGHNQMMSEYCLGPDFQPKPKNNAVLEKLLIIDPSPTSVSVRELAGKCPLVMDAPDKSAYWDELTFADVESCRTPFRVADFLNLGNASSHGETACTLAAPESAFRIVYPQPAELETYIM